MKEVVLSVIGVGCIVMSLLERGAEGCLGVPNPTSTSSSSSSSSTTSLSSTSSTTSDMGCVVSVASADQSNVFLSSPPPTCDGTTCRFENGEIGIVFQESGCPGFEITIQHSGGCTEVDTVTDFIGTQVEISGAVTFECIGGSLLASYPLVDAVGGGSVTLTDVTSIGCVATAEC